MVALQTVPPDAASTTRTLREGYGYSDPPPAHDGPAPDEGYAQLARVREMDRLIREAVYDAVREVNAPRETFPAVWTAEGAPRRWA